MRLPDKWEKTLIFLAVFDMLKLLRDYDQQQLDKAIIAVARGS